MLEAGNKQDVNKNDEQHGHSGNVALGEGFYNGKQAGDSERYRY